jgi:hypothetical protein
MSDVLFLLKMLCRQIIRTLLKICKKIIILGQFSLVFTLNFTASLVTVLAQNSMLHAIYVAPLAKLCCIGNRACREASGGLCVELKLMGGERKRKNCMNCVAQAARWGEI